LLSNPLAIRFDISRIRAKPAGSSIGRAVGPLIKYKGS
jgi:hypothetical protein